MIYEIKQYLKTLTQDITNIPDRKTFLVLKEENQYKTPPWISILSKDADMDEYWQKEQKDFNADKLILITKKYEVIQPVVIAIAGKTESDVSTWLNQILSELPKRIEVKDQVITIVPKQIQYIDNVSHVGSIYSGALRIEFYYGIYSSKELDRLKIIN